MRKQDYRWNPSTCICKNGRCLKGIADTSVISCDETKYAMNIVSTNVANNIPTNAISTVWINYNNKKVR